MFDPPSLIATQLKKDPRLKQASDAILQIIEEYQKKITGIRPAQTELIQSYQQLLNQFAEYRGGKLYFPYIGSGIGNGPLVELLDGSVKYDMISGIGPHYWGHSHTMLIQATMQAAISNTVMQGHLQQNHEAIELCRLLIETSQLEHCFLSSSGAMANENALKIAFQKKHPASRVLAFERGFAGRTLALAQVTDKADFRDGLPHFGYVDYIPFYKAEAPEESIQLSVMTLKKHLARHPKQYAAMIFELIQGEAGFYPGSHKFFSSIMQVLKDHGITIIVDEIQTFGRTTHLYAFQYFELEKYVDIVTIGKLSQVCATLFSDEYTPRPGLLSQTFISSTSALQASIAIIKSLLKEGFLGTNGRIAQVHDLFRKEFKRIEDKYSHLIRGPYGVGSMIAFTPFDGEHLRVSKYIQDLFHAGVISFTAGGQPTRVRFLVPVGAIKDDDIEKVIKIVEDVLRSV